jgi:hypothetical protein
MFLGQPYLVNAAAIIVITAVVQRSLWKYEDRGYRYILLEAGHVAQNINLCAEGMGLASLNLGGFFDEDVMALLRLDQDREIVVYGVGLAKRQPRIVTNGGGRRRPMAQSAAISADPQILRYPVSLVQGNGDRKEKLQHRVHRERTEIAGADFTSGGGAAPRAAGIEVRPGSQTPAQTLFSVSFAFSALCNLRELLIQHRGPADESIGSGC